MSRYRCRVLGSGLTGSGLSFEIQGAWVAGWFAFSIQFVSLGCIE